MRRALAFVVAAALSVACQAAGSSQQIPPIVLPAAAPADVPDDVWQDARSFYSNRAQEFAWVSGDKPTALAARALDTLRTVEDHGLNPDAYGQAALRVSMERLRSAAKPSEHQEALTDFDVRLTLALLQASRHVAIGRLSPAVIEPRWNVRRSAPDFSGLLASAAAGSIESLFDRVQPVHPEYRALRAALASLRVSAAAEETTESTSELHRVAMNLERWRWMPDHLGRRHVLVNVPTYDLVVREDGNTVLDMRVIVGKRGNETPLFHDQIESVVFSPYWNIPDAIAGKETVPAARRDPLFLSRNNIEILDGSGEIVSPYSVDWDDPGVLAGLRLRQRPGPTNALGSVKFVFPNEHAVYLHDTNAPALFKRSGRALSHGCVRVEQPENLARYILRGQPQWTHETIRDAMRAGNERHVPLTEHLPVYIVYMTVWVDASGALRFADDVYGYDIRQARH